MAREAFDSQTGGISDIWEVTLSLDTSAYADGDLMADVQEIENAVRPMDDGNGTAWIESLTVIDKDDQAGAFDVYITDESTTWGTENDAVSLSDAVADGIQRRISVNAGDYYDVGGSKVADIELTGRCGKIVKSPNNSTSLYVAVVSRDTKTYTASGVILKFGVMLD